MCATVVVVITHSSPFLMGGCGVISHQSALSFSIWLKQTRQFTCNNQAKTRIILIRVWFFESQIDIDYVSWSTSSPGPSAWEAPDERRHSSGNAEGPGDDAAIAPTLKLVSVVFCKSKMATTFPSLLPRLSDDLWFSLDKRLDDDAVLTKEEKEYIASVCLGRCILSITRQPSCA